MSRRLLADAADLGLPRYSSSYMESSVQQKETMYEDRKININVTHISFYFEKLPPAIDNETSFF